MEQVAWARELARSLVAEPLPRRWAHLRGVAERAASLAPILGDDSGTVTAAAWLHDIGYAPPLVDTGFHPLDGARYLRDVQRADPTLCRLVAHHSGAVHEAAERGLLDVLTKEFDPARGDLAQALAYSDMTTGPDGRHVAAVDRLGEIHARYGRNHLVTRSITAATPDIMAAVAAVERRLADVRG